MLEHDRTRLLAVAVGAAFVLSRHGKAACGLHDVGAVRIVALCAIHPAFDDRMVLRQVKFGVRFEVALKTGRGVFAEIDDEFFSAASLNVQTARAMTGFTTALARPGIRREVQARMRACRKFLDNVCVAIFARVIAHENRTGNFRR